MRKVAVIPRQMVYAFPTGVTPGGQLVDGNDVSPSQARLQLELDVQDVADPLLSRRRLFKREWR